MCTQDKVNLTSNFAIDRQVASVLITVIDCCILFILTWAVIKLKLYERLAIFDIRNGKMKIEDFSVCIRSIPIEPEEYNNDIDLLKAMVVTHLEEVVKGEAMVNPEFHDIIKNEDQLISCHFGLTSYNIMQHLVKIYDTVKEIKILKGKISNDPLNASKYERESWKLYE